MNDETMTRPEGAETPVVGYCRACGKALQEGEARLSQGITYCADHVPAEAPPPPGPRPATGSPNAYQSPEALGTSPGLAFLLGFIPGVGAVYNQQYAKGLIHVVVFGLLITVLNAPGTGGLEPLFGMLVGLWVFYMAFEAYHTSKKRQLGQPVDEFSSILPVKNHAGSKAGPIVLIAGGIMFLLITLDLIAIYRVIRFWPVLLIAVGAYLLYNRITEDRRDGVRDE